jgi:hypothetical protein
MGTPIKGGFAAAQSSITVNIENSLNLGSTINGSSDKIILAVRPLSANADIQGAMTWREYQ